MSKKSNFRRVVSAAIAALLCVSLFSTMPAIADNNSTDAAADTNSTLFVKQKTYSEYYDEIADMARPDKEVEMTYVGAEDGAKAEVGRYEGKDDVIVWSNEEGKLNFEVDVPQDGAYSIEMGYIQIEGGTSVSEVSVLLDGVSPYDSAARVNIPRIWKGETEIGRDSKDNDVRPVQVENPMWTVTSFKDEDGLFNEPLLFALTAGKHTITLESERAMIAIEYIKLFNQSDYPKYEKPSASELSENAGAENIRIQGEQYAYTNSQTLFPTYDRGNYLTEPSDPTKQRYNTVGDGTWDNSGQAITWEFDVEKSGYYKLNLKSRQNELRGLFSNRRIYIDGEVPSEPFAEVKFYYDDDWCSVVPEDENGEPAYVYLKSGKHSVTLECIPGDIGESMRNLDAIVYDANQYYMEILMITGPTPDEYTDYNVHKEIPTLLPAFADLAVKLRNERATIEELAGVEGTEAAALDRLADVLEKCVDKPYRIPKFLGTIKDNVTAVSSWMRQYRSQPLEIDYIEIVPADGECTSVKKNFFKDLAFNTKALVGSFFEDYTVLSDVTADSINVWVGIGRDQTNVIKQMTDSQFSTEYDIDVSVNLVQGTIMEAVLAGKGPDVALFIGGEFPVNLAIRGLLQPVNNLDGFDEVKERFQENAMVMYSYDENVYGVPLTQSFPMMFYRKDMLAEVGIAEPPATWDELIDILPALQRKYMQPGLVLPPAAISPATEAGHTFALLMLQTGTNYYNEDQTATNFDSQAAVDAFAKWTDFYNVYKFDQTYDAFTRFRTGEAPIVIQNYCTFYNQLNTAAPEIKGLWDFAPVPGTLQDDGTVSNAANSNGSGAIILRDCKNVEAAWTYIKWFTETETMVEYGQNVEGVMGPLGRFESANMEALKKLNWSKKDLEKIMAQMEQLEEIPIVPSAYVVTRDIMNAFRGVVNDKENARETLRLYNIDINNEITRKRENLGLDT
ncbi:MAG: extracellular solute-binding protein [Oscillospiraceae bacterium]|nr:extracellular solute-binding protein [Oscillospiraceae bacterium]